jgi:hypothetical protein
MSVHGGEAVAAFPVSKWRDYRAGIALITRLLSSTGLRIHEKHRLSCRKATIQRNGGSPQVVT